MNEYFKKSSGDKIINESSQFTLDVIWLTLAQLFVSVIFGVITLPALTKSYSSEIYGTWIQVSATVVLLSPLLSLQLGLAVVKFLAGEEDKEKRRRYLGSMILAIILFTIILTLVSLLLSRNLSIILFASPEYTIYVYLVAAWTFFNAFYNFFLSYLRARNRIKGVSISYICITIAQMLVILLMSKISADLKSIVVGIICIQAIFALGILLWIIKDTGFPLLGFTGLKDFLRFSIPQMPGVILLWVIGLSDRYFITHFIGLAQDGVYSSSNTIAGLITMFYAPISYALFPLMSRFWVQLRYKDVKKYFEYSIKIYLTLAIPGAIGIYLSSQQLLNFLTTSEFLAGKELVLLLASGSVFLGLYQISFNLVLLGNYARLMPILTASASATNLIANFFLIPRIGIIGAAISNCIAYMLLAILTIVYAQRTLNFELDFKYLGKVIIACIIMWICLLFLKFDGFWGLGAMFLVGSLVFLVSLVLIRAFSVVEMQLFKSIILNTIFSYFKQRR